MFTDKSALSKKDGFPANMRISTAKYRYASTDANDLPFTFSFWPSEGSVTFEVEYNSG